MWKSSQWRELLFVLVVLSFPVAGTTQEKTNALEMTGEITGSGPATLWRSPEDIASRNLMISDLGASFGAAGSRLAPE